MYVLIRTSHIDGKDYYHSHYDSISEAEDEKNRLNLEQSGLIWVGNHYTVITIQELVEGRNK